MQYGYARVSTQEQDLQLQIDALRKVGVDFLFEKRKSSTNPRRPHADEAIRLLNREDGLVASDAWHTRRDHSMPPESAGKVSAAQAPGKRYDPPAIFF